MKTIPAFLILLLTVISLPVRAEIDIRSMCVNGICLENSSSTYRSLHRKIGSGVLVKHKDDTDISAFCYFDSQKNLWAEFAFQGALKPSGPLTSITLTTVPICAKSPSASIASNGVGVGLILMVGEGKAGRRFGGRRRRVGILPRPCSMRHQSAHSERAPGR